MTSARRRSWLLAAASLLLLVVAWLYLAPTQIGGTTNYVVTGGVSMEPRFHTGDLAVVRPAAEYRVGDIVAYHSTLLHVVVLHRIIGRSGAHYIIKGDNNNFVDPTRPVRAQLVGKLWLHVPHGGLVLHWLHTPLGAALLVGVCALLALLGAGEGQRRRSRRRRRTTLSGAQRSRPMKTAETRMRNARALSSVRAAGAIAALLFLGLGAFAFSRPANRRTASRIPYTQRVKFGYRADAPAGPVYPAGVVRTGDPIFLSLVHRLRFSVTYHLSTAVSHELTGTERVFLTLAGSNGWTRTLALGPGRRFSGPDARTEVTVDLAALQSLIGRVQQMTGVPGGASYTVAISPHVRVRGLLAARTIDATFAPTLNFQLSSSQLQPIASAGASGLTAHVDPNTSQTSAVAGVAITGNGVAVLGHHVPVALLRWIAVIGFALSAVLAVFATVARRLAPSDEAARIQAGYGHLIVPVVGEPDGMGGAPLDVPTIAALARLAESGQRLILHSREGSRDTYLVVDEGTVYRYRADPGNVVWGEWSAAGPRPLSEVAAVPMRAAPSARPVEAPAVASAVPKVWPAPSFVVNPQAEGPTELRQTVTESTVTPASATVTPAMPAPTMPAARPSRVRLSRWWGSQADLTRLVRDVGAAFLGTGSR